MFEFIALMWLTDIIVALQIALIMAMFGGLSILGIWLIHNINTTQPLPKKRWWVAALMCGMLAAVLPSEKTMRIATYGYGAKVAAQTEIGEEAIGFIKDSLKKLRKQIGD